MAQIIHNHLGGTKDPVAAAVAALGDFQNDLIGLTCIMAHGNRRMPVGIERTTNGGHRLNAVLEEQLPQLLQCQRHPLLQLGRSCGRRGKGAFEIVECRQQVADKGFFLSRSLLLGIPPSAFLKILKVGRQLQIIILLGSQLLLEFGKIPRRRAAVGSDFFFLL